MAKSIATPTVQGSDDSALTIMVSIISVIAVGSVIGAIVYFSKKPKVALSYNPRQNASAAQRQYTQKRTNTTRTQKPNTLSNINSLANSINKIASNNYKGTNESQADYLAEQQQIRGMENADLQQELHAGDNTPPAVTAADEVIQPESPQYAGGDDSGSDDSNAFIGFLSYE